MSGIGEGYPVVGDVVASARFRYGWKSNGGMIVISSEKESHRIVPLSPADSMYETDDFLAINTPHESCGVDLSANDESRINARFVVERAGVSDSESYYWFLARRLPDVGTTYNPNGELIYYTMRLWLNPIDVPIPIVGKATLTFDITT
jgi:hypothetical protein